MTGQQGKVGIDIKLVTVVTSHQDYTSEFFEEEVLPEKYRIIKISEGKYGLADLKSKECEIFFKKISKINNYYYLLEFENGNKSLLMLWEKQPLCSEAFQELIQAFGSIFLVKDLNGERKLIGWTSDGCFACTSSKKYFCSEWIRGEESNNTVLRSEGKEVILLKDGLTLVDNGYKKVMGYANQEIDNIFRIVEFEDGSLAVIRINDLQESDHFKDVKYISQYRREGSIYSKNCVKVIFDDGQKAVLRISDFKISQKYDDIVFLSLNYAVVYCGEKSNIMRLSDLAEAQWS